LAFVGTLYGGLTAGARGRETLLPLLLLPVVAPVLICATRATESAFRSGGVTVGEGWPWVAVLAVFAAVFGLGGLLSFGSLIEKVMKFSAIENSIDELISVVNPELYRNRNEQ